MACFVVEDLRDRRVPIDGLLKEVGLTQGDLADPDARVPYHPVLKLLDRASALSGDASYALRLGASRDTRDRGLLGFLALNSPTLIDAMLNLQRYRKVAGANDDFQIEPGGSLVALQFREVNPVLRAMRHHSEYLAGSIIRACRDMAGKSIGASRIEFCHAKPTKKVAYDEILGCPVRFDAPWDTIFFTQETMRLAVNAADNKLLRVLMQACEKVVGPTSEKRQLVREVEKMIVDQLHKGTATIEEIARGLNMSSKTLERRLAERGHRFSDVLDDVRCRTAKHFLKETDLRIFQVAYMAGYTESAALVRAFKRWTGKTPLEFRHGPREMENPPSEPAQ